MARADRRYKNPPFRTRRTDLESVIEAAQGANATLLIVDSIQTLWSDALPAAPGTVTQVRACSQELIRLAKARTSLPLDKAVAAVVENLNQISKRLSTKEEMKQVASISANNDDSIGGIMADAFEKVGKDGVITVEEGKTSETTLEFVEGMQFDKGYCS
ncbi:MAG: hypothetical protein HC856_06570, partial [Pseudanabaena sp. RU_4_16]|nr:hypothetical protein [Pseudanabaena sp. RU_4_16]